ncbi:9537_t:CDS:2 [Paraglomus brasilianum]|uniref:9537_t:CDS:1 n=1 Tax=Paraglomus brasilianum TaxID=144538 RepID=A0A9N9G2F7_9GLOM|nr:9537_t:CDS:2 [Paraglomus brasilianum]
MESSTRTTTPKTQRQDRILQHQSRFSSKNSTPILPPIKLSFPPEIDIKDFVSKLLLSRKKRLGRFPNAFIMYRNVYVRYLKDKGYHLPMTDLSPMIGWSWKQESEEVKKWYTSFSIEVEKLYFQMDCFDTSKKKPATFVPSTVAPVTTDDKTDSGIEIQTLLLNQSANALYSPIQIFNHNTVTASESMLGGECLEEEYQLSSPTYSEWNAAYYIVYTNKTSDMMTT